MNLKQAKIIFKRITADICDQEQYLSELDGAIGDGDHGHNIAKGMKCVEEKIQNSEYDDFQSLFKDVAMQLISNVGGASGPLYGTAFMEMSKECKDKKELQLKDLLILLKAAIRGIQKRGKSDINEKTMLDVIVPVTNKIENIKVENLKDNSEEIINFINISCDKTKDIIATKGRASYLQERSIGHIDPGAKSMSIFLIDLVEGIVNG